MTCVPKRFSIPKKKVASRSLNLTCMHSFSTPPLACQQVSEGASPEEVSILCHIYHFLSSVILTSLLPQCLFTINSSQCQSQFPSVHLCINHIHSVIKDAKSESYGICPLKAGRFPFHLYTLYPSTHTEWFQPNPKGGQAKLVMTNYGGG